MPPVPKNRSILALFWRFHRWLYETSDGRLGSTLFGQKVLKLTTTGHRSGKTRSILIFTFPYEDSNFIIASNAGSTRVPAWYRNLQADPHAQVQIGRRRMAVVARTAAGAEREQLWAEAVRQEKSFAGYEESAQREIPVVVLDPVV